MVSLNGRGLRYPRYLQEYRQMWLFIQTWLPLLGIILTASVCFAAASFFMAQARPQRQ